MVLITVKSLQKKILGNRIGMMEGTDYKSIRYGWGEPEYVNKGNEETEERVSYL